MNTYERHDANDPIAHHLRSHASAIDIAGQPITVVISRGRQRQHRHRTVVGLTSVVAVVAATAGLVAVLTRPAANGTATKADSPATSDTVPGEITNTTYSLDPTSTTMLMPGDLGSIFDPAIEIPSELVWNRVDPNSAEALSMITGPVVGDGPYLAWSTAPASASLQIDPNYRPVLWRSTDSTRWEQLTTPVPVSSSSGLLAAHGGQFLTFGTMPAASASGQITAAVATSADAGNSWQTTALPIDTTAVRADPAVSSVSVAPIAFAVGDAGIVAAARVQVNLDYQRILPSGAMNRSWHITTDGIFVDADSCATPPTNPAMVDTTNVAQPTTVSTIEMQSGPTTISMVEATANDCANPQPATQFSWSELGVSPTTASALFDTVRFFFSAPDGEFTAIDGPINSSGWPRADTRITSYNGGFAAVTVAYTPDGAPLSSFATSTDGRTWVDAPAPPLAGIESLVSMGDRIAAWGYNVTGTVVALRSTDGTWIATDLNGLLRPDDGVKPTFNAGSVLADSTGITVTGWITKDPVAEAGGVEMTRNGVTIRAEDGNGNMRLLDAATGAELGQFVNGASTSDLVEVVDTGLAVRLAAGEPVVARFSYDDIYGTLMVKAPSDFKPTHVVLHSTDAVHWSRESLADLAGEPVLGWGNVHGNGTQVIVTIGRANTVSPGTVAQPMVLIGTPRA